MLKHTSGKTTGTKTLKPFFRLYGDEETVIDNFMDAVRCGSFEIAAHYLSRLFRNNCILDYDRLKNILGNTGGYTKLTAIRFSNIPGNIRPSSLLLKDSGGSILHVYTRIEPDNTSRCKICGLETENI